jgi:hypothetical protein
MLRRPVQLEVSSLSEQQVVDRQHVLSPRHFNEVTIPASAPEALIDTNPYVTSRDRRQRDEAYPLSGYLRQREWNDLDDRYNDSRKYDSIDDTTFQHFPHIRRNSIHLHHFKIPRDTQ